MYIDFQGNIFGLNSYELKIDWQRTNQQKIWQSIHHYSLLYNYTIHNTATVNINSDLNS